MAGALTGAWDIPVPARTVGSGAATIAMPGAMAGAWLLPVPAFSIVSSGPTVTPKGTVNVDNSGFGTTATIASVTLATGDLLVLSLSEYASSVPTSVTWNGNALALDKNAASGIGQDCRVYSYKVVSGGTGNIVATWSDGFQMFSAAMSATGIAGLTNGNVDSSASNTGNSDSPDSTGTATLGSDSKYIHGAVCTNGPVSDAAGTWGGGFTADQRDGTTSFFSTTISDAYLLSSATTIRSATKTGITSRAWAAVVVAYK